VFRTERLWRFFGLGIVGSIQTHVGGATFGAVGFGLAGVSTQSVAGWQRSPIQAWSGLSGAGSVRPGCGGMSAWAGAVSFFSTSLRGKWGKRFRTLEFFEFFFFFFFFLR